MTRKCAALVVLVARSCTVGSVVLAHAPRPETQEFTRTFTVAEKEIIPEERYGLIMWSPTTYQVSLTTEGGNTAQVHPTRREYMEFPAVGEPVAVTYESTDEGGRLITNILEVRYGN